MADPLPVVYRTSPLAIATYPYSEIVDGTGVVTFYGSRVSIDSTAANDEYLLITDAIISSISNTTLASGGDGLDFDVQFRATKTIEGTAYFSLPLSINHGGAASITPSIEVIHYNSVAGETQLVAATSMPVLTTAAGQVYGDRVLKVTIPRTKFAIGDILRLTMTAVITAGTAYLFHDPSGSTANFATSGGQMKAYIPFEVEI